MSNSLKKYKKVGEGKIYKDPLYELRKLFNDKSNNDIIVPMGKKVYDEYHRLLNMNNDVKA